MHCMRQLHLYVMAAHGDGKHVIAILSDARNTYTLSIPTYEHVIQKCLVTAHIYIHTYTIYTYGYLYTNINNAKWELGAYTDTQTYLHASVYFISLYEGLRKFTVQYLSTFKYKYTIFAVQCIMR